MQDYYPFGSKMPGRSIPASSFYKQGYPEGRSVPTPAIMNRAISIPILKQGRR